MKLELEQIREEEEEERRKKRKIKKKRPSFQLPEKEKIIKKPQVQEKPSQQKLILPNVFFNEVKTSQELYLLNFRKKLLKKKFIIPQVIFQSINLLILTPILTYRKLLIKRKLILPSVNFNKSSLNGLISVISYKREVKLKKLILPSVIFSKVAPQQELSMYYHFEKKEKKEILVEKAEKKMEVSVGSEGGVFVFEEEKNLIDLFFERKKWGSEIATTREPYIIFLIERENEQIKEVVKSILQRFIEEMEESFEGFKEESIGFKNSGEEEKRKKEIERNLDVLRKIFIVNLKRLEDLDKLDIVSILDRINEFKSKGLGFLIFHLVEDCRIENIENWCKDKLDRLTYQPNLHIWKIKREPKNFEIIGNILGYNTSMLKRLLNSEEANKLLVSTFSKRETYDFLFEIGRKLQLKNRAELKSNLSEVVKRDEGEEESELHYDLKCLVVLKLIRQIFGIKKVTHKFILDNLKEIKGKIKTEEEELSSDEQKIKADIKFEEKEVWEIETLFSQGKKAGVPLKKIDETIEKYGEKDMKINIVIDNLTLFLHFPEIKRKLEFWKKAKNNKIDFWVPDWENEDLKKII
jgi:hypothetical protein